MSALDPGSSLFNRLAWRLAAGLAAAAALLAVVLTGGPNVPPLPPTHSPGVTSTPGEAEITPSPATVGGDIERCIGFCIDHVTIDRSFVIFSNGTCVIVNEPSENPLADAILTLEECAGPNARFLTQKVEDENYLVTYRKAAFHCLFSDQIDAERSLIEREFPRYMTDLERKSMGTTFHPPFHAKLGLVARARLNKDAADLSVRKIVRAREAVEGPRHSAPLSPNWPEATQEQVRQDIPDPALVPGT